MTRWTLLLVALLALAAAAQDGDAPADEPPAANKDAGIGDATEPPAEEPPPREGPQPPAGAAGAQAPAAEEPIPALPPPPTDAGEVREPESIAPPAAAPARRKAFIDPLDANTVIETQGPDNKVVARGKLQMTIPDDEVIVYCNAVDYSGETTGIATVTGDLKVLTGPIQQQNGRFVIPVPENTLTGEIAYVFTKEKRIVVDHDVIVVHDPPENAPPDADQFEQAQYDTTTLYCDRLTYWYRKGDRKAVAQARLPNTKIRFVQSTRRGTAGMATFYDFEPGQTETGDVVDLVGGVYGEDDLGQLIESEVARLFIDQDTSQWYNLRRAVVNLDEETTPAPAPATATPTPLPEVPDNTATPAPTTPPVAEPGAPPGEIPATEPEVPTTPATEPEPEPEPAAPAG